MWPWHMTTWGWGGMLIGGTLMLLFWVAVIALAFLVVRSLARSDRFTERRDDDAGTNEQTALDIIKERYARGEITREEYQRMRNDLEN